MLRATCPPSSTACNLFGNEHDDWVGDIADQYGGDCNMAADPIYCEPGTGDFTLDLGSPCLPEDNPCGVQIGAFGAGCDTVPVGPEIGAPARVAERPNLP